VDGKFEHSFKLCFDFNALALIEKHLGVNLLVQFSQIFSISASSVSVFLWAAIQAQHPEYEGEEGLAVVRSYLNIANFEAAAVKVQEAFKLSLNKEQLDRVEAALAAAQRVIDGEAAAGASDPLVQSVKVQQ
jgi:hypothetical protein